MQRLECLSLAYSRHKKTSRRRFFKDLALGVAGNSQLGLAGKVKHAL